MVTGIRAPQPRGWKESSQACAPPLVQTRGGGPTRRQCASQGLEPHTGPDQSTVPLSPTSPHSPQSCTERQGPHRRLPGGEMVTIPDPRCCFLNVLASLCPTPCHLISWRLQERSRKKTWTSRGCPRIGAGGLCLPTSQRSAENYPKLRVIPKTRKEGTPAHPGWGRAGWGSISGAVYLRACLKLCNVHLMGKFEKNSTGFVLVKGTLRIFNSCLGHVTLKSGDRRDKLTVLFVIGRARERRQAMGRGQGSPSPSLDTPLFPACRPGC